MSEVAIPTLVNGEAAAAIPILDRGLQYGDGLFETIKVAEGRPEFWDRHMERLSRGSARLRIPAIDRALLKGEAERLCRGGADGVLKIIVTRGPGGRGYRAPDKPAPTRILALYPPPDRSEDLARKGVAARFCETRLAIQPLLAGIKHLNRLEQVLARAEWGDADTAEGLMSDAEGFVIEGTMSNLFLVRNGGLVTPDLARCGVAGVMRAVVLDLARRDGVPCEVGKISRADCLAAEEIFLTNSVIGIWPVRRLEGRELRVGPVTAALQRSLAQTNRS